MVCSERCRDKFEIESRSDIVKKRDSVSDQLRFGSTNAKERTCSTGDKRFKLTGRSEGSNAGGRGQKGDKGFGELHLELSECGYECGNVLFMNPTVEKRLRRQERQISLSLMWSPLNLVVLPFLKDSRLTWMRTPATNEIGVRQNLALHLL